MGWRNLPTSISAAINMAATNGQAAVTVQWLEQLGTEDEEAEVEIMCDFVFHSTSILSYVLGCGVYQSTIKVIAR